MMRAACRNLSLRVLVGVVVVLLASTVGTAKGSDVVPPGPPSTPVVLFPDGPPGEPAGLVGPEDLSHRTSPNGYVLDIITNVSVPTITPFLADGCESNCPAVVIAPGGAYHILAFNMEGTDVARRFNAMGVSAFVLKYRVPDVGVRGDPSKPFGWAPLQDAQRAMGVVSACSSVASASHTVRLEERSLIDACSGASALHSHRAVAGGLLGAAVRCVV
jgi:hypothetical protein